MTIDEWIKDFKSYINELQMPRDDYKGIMAYIDEGAELLKEQEPVTPEEVSMYPQINMLAVAAAMFQSEPKTITQNSARRADGR